VKHLKEFKLFESVKCIDEICEKYGIKNYTINSDGSVDVDGDVYLSHKKLDKLPVRFGKVTGYFSSRGNDLTSLEGCPASVGRDFYCSNNQLSTLEGGPRKVGGHFFCYNNQLTTLEGCPTEVGGRLWCQNNQLTTLEGLTDVFIGGEFVYDKNPIHKLVGGWLITDMVPDMGKIELFNDLYVISGNKLYLSKLEYFHEEIGADLPNLEEVKKYYEIIK
jgi:hypothetical protein